MHSKCQVLNPFLENKDLLHCTYTFSALKVNIIPPLRDQLRIILSYTDKENEKHFFPFCSQMLQQFAIHLQSHSVSTTQTCFPFKSEVHILENCSIILEN